MEEIWQDIPGYEGRYQVSNLGRVRYIAITVLRPCLNKAGYRVVTLRDAAKAQKQQTVHRLVMETFVGPRPEGMHIAHYDGDSQNNNLNNLRYATPKENIGDDRRRHGTLPKGGANYCAKLTEADVLAIRQSADSAKELAIKHNVDKTTIQKARNGTNWKHLAV